MIRKLNYLLINLIIIIILLQKKIELRKKYPNHIFTFWEPIDKIPGYINLSIETWKKYLPEYKLVILNYSNLKYFLSYSMIYKIVNKGMMLMSQADAIRIAVLLKYGGIWMDPDTIITNSYFLQMFKGVNLGMYATKVSNKSFLQFTGFIYSSKHSKIIKTWYRYIIKNLRFYKLLSFISIYTFY